MIELFNLSYIWLIPVAVAISMFASIVGIGGGLLWAPFFILVLDMSVQEAAMYSFAIQIVGMASASFSNIIQKNVCWSIVLILVPVILAGEVIGSYLNQVAISSIYLQGAMGVMSIAVSLVFAFQYERYDTKLNKKESIKPPPWVTILCLPFGMLSGLFSVGIGDNLVPIFRGKLKIPMKFAIGTTLFLNFVIACAGIFMHLFMSGKNYTFLQLDILVMCWAGVFAGGQIGPRLSRSIEDTRLKEIFIFVLMLIGIHLIYKSI